MKEIDLNKYLKELLGIIKEKPAPNSPFPLALEGKYFRESTARILGDLEEFDELVLGALIRTSILDEEDDVKEASLESIVKLAPDIAPFILLAATFDNDEKLRCAGLNLLWQIDKMLTARIAKIMLKDDFDWVSIDAQNVIKILKNRNEKIDVADINIIGLDRCLNELIGIIKKKTEPNSLFPDYLPDYLVDKYYRDGTARVTVDFEEVNELVIGALIRASILDEDADVRKQSIEAIVRVVPELAPFILISATFDIDSNVKCAAIELLWKINKTLVKTIVRDMIPEGTEFVRQGTKKIIELCKDKSKEQDKPIRWAKITKDYSCDNPFEEGEEEPVARKL